jgi:proteasome beta subunit
VTELSGDGLVLEAGTPASSFAALLRSRDLDPRGETEGQVDAPEGTTVLAFRYAEGVLMAGDRRATAGNYVAHRRVQKVYAADSYSAVAISGTAGVAIELVRLFQTELEHYEKIEGRRLSLSGKANHLASMVRRHLPMAFQGLVVIPLFCGYDEQEEEGRLYSYDVVGGSYEETDYAATGSGGRDARLYLRTKFTDDMSRDAALELATGGPDLKRGIYPNIVTVSTSGYAELPEDEIAAMARTVMERSP